MVMFGCSLPTSFHYLRLLPVCRLLFVKPWPILHIPKTFFQASVYQK
jgi:hypothetical protein